jgi:aspartate/methionine/tyrosine aminotransferase
MNFAPPKWIVDSAETALRGVAENHYSHPRGRLRLRQALKNFYDPLFGRDVDVNSEVLVTSGANEGTRAVINLLAIFTNKYYRSILCLHCLSGPWRRSDHVRAVL